MLHGIDTILISSQKNHMRILCKCYNVTLCVDVMCSMTVGFSLNGACKVKYWDRLFILCAYFRPDVFTCAYYVNLLLLIIIDLTRTYFCIKVIFTSQQELRKKNTPNETFIRRKCTEYGEYYLSSDIQLVRELISFYNTATFYFSLFGRGNKNG